MEDGFNDVWNLHALVVAFFFCQVQQRDVGCWDMPGHAGALTQLMHGHCGSAEPKLYQETGGEGVTGAGSSSSSCLEKGQEGEDVVNWDRGS